MPRIAIDSREIEVPAGATVLEAARQAGIDIPTMCFLEGLPPNTSCMVCLVKVAGRSRLAPACATPVEDGMRVVSDSPDVHAARRAAVALLLSDHLGDCDAPCQCICPARMNIPSMARQIRDGNIRDAIITVKRDLALPATLGRICPAPCEKGCRRGALDAAVAIRCLHRQVADADLAGGSPYMPPCAAASGKRVAIVGAGPAGLGAAYHLLQLGHACTIFDDRQQPGGMLRYGVDPAVLPPDILDAEIGVIRRMGAEMRTAVHVGRDVSLDDLRRQFDAVAIAVGAVTKDDDRLGLPGSAQAVTADHHTHQTAVAGVFVGGDAMGGRHRMAVRAMADGKAVAASIHQYLAGLPSTGAAVPFTCHIGHLMEGEIASFAQEGAPGARNEAGPGGLSAAQATDESARCLHCDCRKADACKLRTYAHQYGAHVGHYRGQRRTFQQDRSHAAVLYEPGKCIQCGLCVQIAERHREELGLAFIGRGFSVRVAGPFNSEVAEALRTAAAQCAAACPTGAIVSR